MVGKTVAPATYWVFEYTGRLFKEFIQKKYELSLIHILVRTYSKPTSSYSPTGTISHKARLEELFVLNFTEEDVEDSDCK